MPWYRAAITTESEYGQTLMCIPLESGDHYARKPVIWDDIEGIRFVFIVVVVRLCRSAAEARRVVVRPDQFLPVL